MTTYVSIAQIKEYKMARLKRVIFNKVSLSVLMTAAILATLLLTNLPAKAMSITVTNPSSGTLRSAYSFSVTINVENSDVLPIQNVNMQITNAAAPSTYFASCTNLPLPTSAGGTATGSYSDPGTFGTVSVSGTSGANWGYGYDASRYGYGYGYISGTYGYSSFASGYGYGYNNGSTDLGPTSITYSIVWYPPTNWPTGTYNIQVTAYGTSGDSTTAFTNTAAAFTMAAAPANYTGGGTPGGAFVVTPGTTNVSNVVNYQGVFSQTVNVTSADNLVNLNIPSGTVGKTAGGASLTQISINPMTTPPAPPTGANVIGLTYDFGPAGATFNPAISMKFTYTAANIPTGVTEANLVVAFYDTVAGQWVTVPVVVDTVNHTITAQVTHFTAFSVMNIPAKPVTTTTPAVITTTTTTTTTTTAITSSTPTTTPTSAVVTQQPTTTMPTSASANTPITTLAPPAKKVNLWIVGGIIAAVVVIAVILLYFLVWRRKPTTTK
jgi:hypothetical protein